MGVQASLVYTAADGAKQDLLLHVGEDTTIGRHPNCSLTISQPSVSRRHARLWFDQGVWFVEDLQSSNGTFVNNRRINRAQLTEGDELRCGDFVLMYGIEEKTRAVQTSDRRERPPLPVSNPQVSNRATVGLESPPPIPEAPRLAPAVPAAPTPPAPSPAPAGRPESPFDNNRNAGLEDELRIARENEARLQESESKLKAELDALKAEIQDLESERDEATQAASEANASAQALRLERDAAVRDVERLEEIRSKNEDEVSQLSSEKRQLSLQIEDLQDELDALNNAATKEAVTQEADLELLESLKSELTTLKDQLASKEQDLDTLRKDLEEMHLRSSTQVSEKKASVKADVDDDFAQALSGHSSELRVALKAASGFVQEVKEVFASVAKMSPDSSANESVRNVEETFEENGGLDPVNSLETAFDKMEQTARELRRLSKNL